MLCLKWSLTATQWWLFLQLAPKAKQKSDSQVSLHLKPGQTRSFSALPGLRLVCETGSIWLTQSGDACDYVLCAGQEWESKGRGRVVAQALQGIGAEALVVVPERN